MTDIPLKFKLAKVPPFICAVLAKEGRHHLTHAEIAEKSGLSYRMVERISARITWDGVDSDVMSDFAHACRVNLLQPSKVVRYLKSTLQCSKPLPWLSKVQRAAFNRRFERWLESLSK